MGDVTYMAWLNTCRNLGYEPDEVAVSLDCTGLYTIDITHTLPAEIEDIDVVIRCIGGQ